MARDLATHQVHGISRDPAGWAQRVQYTSGYRAVLAHIVAASPRLTAAVGLAAITKFATVKKNVKQRPVRNQRTGWPGATAHRFKERQPSTSTIGLELVLSAS